MQDILKHPDDFVNRHIGPNETEQNQMLKTVGASSLGDLVDQTIPASIRLKQMITLPERVTEHAYLKELAATASRNKVFRSYIGQGYSNCITPPAIQRNILENPGWYTQYTPYQAEIAQGRLEALVNFQTMVMDLTAMEIANASLLDEATAAAEAMAMLHSAANKDDGDRNVFVSSKCLPQTISVLKTRSVPLGISLQVTELSQMKPGKEVFGMLLQYPNDDGSVDDIIALVSEMKQAGIYVAVAADLLSQALLKPPGEFGADVVVGNSQRFGVPLFYGGPHAAFFACRDEFKRLIPGRIIGVSIDADNNTAFRMALQTREQHIRREKATSNICTAQALLAVMAGMYGVYHGPKGIRAIAEYVHTQALALNTALHELGFKQSNAHFFDTLRVNAGQQQRLIKELAEKKRINFRYYTNGDIGIALDETVTASDVSDIVTLFAEVSSGVVGELSGNGTSGTAIPQNLVRKSAFMQHPVFNRFHSETELMRYIKRLENKDLSLTHSMIPLGSCTMKLNAAAELMPVSWPEFAQIHPFAPKEQAEGYRQIIEDLSTYLTSIAGLDSCSLQPNSGAQGEYAGLMVIREYHHHNNEVHRNVVLIPSSAHGTNPASAVMAGMRVVVVACDEVGSIDLDDLRAKAEEHHKDLSALMITYPSTHGVFEDHVQEVCRIIHSYGGQVYMDGANLNAMVGISNPGIIGADVCHINLHKTFSIPHGGGGPGMGPICVAKHLAPFLPGHPVVITGGNQAISAVSAAPFGSSAILLISYGYIRMLGREGSTRSTEVAILNANYIKVKLSQHYPVLYTGNNDRVAHELIIDCRQFKNAGIEVEDVAKRLMDYGFHAPTVSFPVPGTLMIEPTESESKEELDRFIDAMISIREEIREVETGIADKLNNVLKRAPHTVATATSDSWDRPYTRERAAYPLPYLRSGKFWASVSRVNNPHGDRNLMCACPPMESYAEPELVNES